MATTPETLRGAAKFVENSAAVALGQMLDFNREARKLYDRADRLERIPKFLRPLLGRFVR